MEHGNSQKGKEGELAVIEAYRQADSFYDRFAAQHPIVGQAFSLTVPRVINVQLTRH